MEQQNTLFTVATCDFTVGKSEFHFEVYQHFRLNDAKYYVLIKQTVDMSEDGLDDMYLTYKVNCPNVTSEHGAIHYAGKKMIKDWDRFARIGKDHPVKGHEYKGSR